MFIWVQVLLCIDIDFTSWLIHSNAGQRLNNINGREVTSEDNLYHNNQRFSAEKTLWMVFSVKKEDPGDADEQIINFFAVCISLY